MHLIGNIAVRGQYIEQWCSVVKMAVNKIPESKCHPDLVKERHAASFDVEEVTELLHFGKGMNERRREISTFLSFTLMQHSQFACFL